MHKSGLISKIQRFSLGDGPGIRTTIFMQGCNLVCPWCHNPETVPKKGAVLYYADRCTSCGKCIKVCPVQAIDDNHIINKSHCDYCGKCEDACLSNSIKVSGTRMTVDGVYTYIIEDMPYYVKSKGGITLSGGEPLLQHEFCIEIAKKCFQNKISVIVDTAGDVPFSTFEMLIPYVECFYFDVKTNKENYKKIGGDGKRIYSNLESLALKTKVVVRIPVIPGFNTENDDVDMIVKTISQMNICEVQLLPFHRLGVGKYKAVGLDYSYADIEPGDDVDHFINSFSIYDNIKCTVDG